MDKELPIWFLDIDGVVNALPGDAAGLGPESQSGKAAGFPLFWRPSVVGFINEVHRQGIAEVHWLTTWGEQARTHFAPRVGLDDFTIAHEPGEYHERGLWWKAAIVKKFTDGGRRAFVFTDDDLDDGEQWDIRNFAPAESALLLRPHSATGLTDDDIAKIAVFLAQHSDVRRIGAMLSHLPRGIASAAHDKIYIEYAKRRGLDGFAKSKVRIHTWDQRHQTMVARGDDPEK